MDVPPEAVSEDLTSSEIGGRFGLHRLLRAGLLVFCAASLLWLVTAACAVKLANDGHEREGKVLILTFTVLLWPAAIVGVLLLVSWLVLTIINRSAGSRTTLS